MLSKKKFQNNILTLIILKKSAIIINNGLVNYWPFTNNVQDSIGGAHLYNGVNAQFTYNGVNDRFNRMNSALSLNCGHYQGFISMELLHSQLG